MGAEQRLATECEAFLDGTLAELRRQRGGVPSAWMVLNLPAHGTRDQLEADAAASGPDSNRWQRARSFLCAEVLDVADSRTMTLADVQGRVLVPLELATCAERLRFSSTLSGVVSSAFDALVMCRRARPERRGRTP